MDLFIKFFYSFKLTVQLFFLNVIFLYNYLSLIKSKTLKKNYLALPYDFCNIVYSAIMYMNFYFNTSMDSTDVGKYSTSMCFYLLAKFKTLIVSSKSYNNA